MGVHGAMEAALFLADEVVGAAGGWRALNVWYLPPVI